MNILQIGMHTLSNATGGVDRYLDGLLKGMEGGGHSVKTLVLGQKSEEERPGVEVIASREDPMWRRLAAFSAGVGDWEKATRGSERIIAAHFAPYSLPLLLRRSVPCVLHFHGPWAAEADEEGQRARVVAVKHWLEKRVYHRANRAITLSEAFKNLLVEQYEYPADRVRVIPGAVSELFLQPAPTKEEARRRLNLGAGPVLLSVRRLARRMGLETLLDAVALLRERHPDLLLLVAGTGLERTALEERVHRLGIQDRVRFVGFVREEDLPFYYAAADLSVLPSWSLEGFGLVILESLAMGTPVVGTRVGGIPEVLEPIAPELLAPPRDARALAAAILRGLPGSPDRPDAGACRSYVETHYRWREQALRVANVYREALGS